MAKNQKGLLQDARKPNLATHPRPLLLVAELLAVGENLEKKVKNQNFGLLGLKALTMEPLAESCPPKVFILPKMKRGTLYSP
jgi:hypothetical protein